MSFFLLLFFGGVFLSSTQAEETYLQISGIYPHLTAHNQVPNEIGSAEKHGEAGIGAVASWAGKLWYLTYPQHQTQGSNDKLYMVDENMNMTVRPESVGGTHANRMIHNESNQLIMGYHFIDAEGKVRTADPSKLIGRMIATMQHLKDPVNKVYFFDMEGAIYEVEVHTLAVTRLFEKPVPGWHGKGAYTAQGHVVMANNGENEWGSHAHLMVGDKPKNDEESGVLAQWDGDRKFEIIERKQFTDVTGPDGISPDADSLDKPLWSIGWDRRSVLLKLLDSGHWYTYRMPKASHTFDHRHGWYTEWPRIREIVPGGNPTWMMVMHGGMYDFPKTFSRASSAGIRPITTHLRYVPDFCNWNGRIVIAADDSSMMENPMCGQAQSNLWFGTLEQLKRFGPKFGCGGVWQNDPVKAGQPSDAYLLGDYRQKTLHIKAEPGSRFTLQLDRKGNNDWVPFHTVQVSPGGYTFMQIDDSVSGEWIRIVPAQDGVATAYFHYVTPRDNRPEEQAEFDSLAEVRDEGPINGGVIRPAAHNRSLQWLYNKNTPHSEDQYLEVELNGKSSFGFTSGKEDRSDEVRNVCSQSKCDFKVDGASVIVTRKDGQRFRLPKGSAAFDNVILRDIREVQSERWLANLHGTFYEIPRWSDNHSPDFEKIKPVSSHTKRITDFCTWRGLLVMAGTKLDAKADGHFFADAENRGLWMGNIDDLWKLGKPMGIGGPWAETPIESSVASDPYLMTGYDKKRIELSHNADSDVQITIEIDFDHTGFVPFDQITVPPGRTVTYTFPNGFNSHWLRLTSDKACKATARCIYE